MIIRHSLLPRIMVIACILMGVCMETSAADSMIWKEEVVLHDGSKIIVERSLTRDGRHEVGQPPPIKEQSLQFDLPGTTQKVIWEDHYSEDVGGASFLPMALEIFEGMPYIVVYPMGCQSYNKWGRPNPPYVIFQFKSKEWRRIPLQEFPPELKRINLIFSSPDIEAEKIGERFISAEMIADITGRYKQLEFQSIVREPLKGGGQKGCTEMIRTNDGWEGLGFFRSQPSYEACLKYCERKGVIKSDCPCETLFNGAK